MVAAVLLPGLLLLFARGMTRFNNHPSVMAVNQRLRTSMEEHRRAWAFGFAAQFVIAGFVQWWLEQFPTALVMGPFYLWVFLQKPPEWLHDAFPEDRARWSDKRTPDPPQDPGGR